MRLIGLIILSCLLVSGLEAQNESGNSTLKRKTISQDSVFTHVRSHGIPGVSAFDSITATDVKIYPNITKYFGDYEATYGWCLNEKQLQRGKEFLQRYENLLEDIEDSLGVDPEAIIATYRVETRFGDITESHQVLGALVSILHYSSDSSWQNWAREQLRALPAASEILSTNLVDLRGSYAGAIGYPQFLPTSIVTYAVDGDGDGRINLFKLEDTLWSIGNYLHEEGWGQNHRDAVLAYNPDDDYADCIFNYRQALH